MELYQWDQYLIKHTGHGMRNNVRYRYNIVLAQGINYLMQTIDFSEVMKRKLIYQVFI